jgi:hypothetical protein
MLMKWFSDLFDAVTPRVLQGPSRTSEAVLSRQPMRASRMCQVVFVLNWLYKMKELEEVTTL